MDQHGAKIFKEKEKACEHAQFQIRKHYLLMCTCTASTTHLAVLTLE